jgi:hypothetical protein
MHIGAILLLALVVLVCLGPLAVIRAIAGLITLVGILLLAVWLITLAPWAHE